MLLGIIVALVNASGGSAAFGRWAEKNIKTRVGASIATFVLGVLIFIDDYFNCLTVGSVMRPVTDGHKISRAKLAYLIDATAAPVCMIAPISSWAAAVSGVASDLDIGVSGIQLFVMAIPYNFYSLLTFVFIIAITCMKFDYGPMRLHEMNAQLNGDLGALESEEGATAANPKGRVIDLILPVCILIVACTVGMIYVGGFFGVDAWGGTDCAGDFIAAFGNTDAFVGLPLGRHYLTRAHRYLHACPPPHDLQGGNGVRPQGLHRHGAAHHHPHDGGLTEDHDLQPRRGGVRA